MKDSTITITLDRTEAAVVSDALNTYARTHIGPAVNLAEVVRNEIDSAARFHNA